MKRSTFTYLLLIMLSAAQMNAGKKEKRQQQIKMPLATYQKATLLNSIGALEEDQCPSINTYSNLVSDYTELLNYACTPEDQTYINQEIALNKNRLELLSQASNQHKPNTFNQLKPLHIKMQKQYLTQLRNTYDQEHPVYNVFSNVIDYLTDQYEDAQFENHCRRLKSRTLCILKAGADTQSYIRLCKVASQMLKESCSSPSQNSIDKALHIVPETKRLAFEANTKHLSLLMQTEVRDQETPSGHNTPEEQQAIINQARKAHEKRIQTQTTSQITVDYSTQNMNNLDACVKGALYARQMQDTYPSYHPAHDTYAYLNCKFLLHSHYLCYNLEALNDLKLEYSKENKQSLVDYAERLIKRIHAEKELDVLQDDFQCTHYLKRKVLIKLSDTYEKSDPKYKQLKLKAKRAALKHEIQYAQQDENLNCLEKHQQLLQLHKKLLATYPVAGDQIELHQNISALEQHIVREQCLDFIKASNGKPLNKALVQQYIVVYNRLCQAASYIQEFYRDEAPKSTVYELVAEQQIEFYHQYIQKFDLIAQLKQIASQEDNHQQQYLILAKLIKLPILTREEKYNFQEQYQKHDALHKRDCYMHKLEKLENQDNLNIQACIDILKIACDLNHLTVQDYLLFNKKLDHYHQLQEQML